MLLTYLFTYLLLSHLDEESRQANSDITCLFILAWRLALGISGPSASSSSWSTLYTSINQPDAATWLRSIYLYLSYRAATFQSTSNSPDFSRYFKLHQRSYTDRQPVTLSIPTEMQRLWGAHFWVPPLFQYWYSMTFSWPKNENPWPWHNIYFQVKLLNDIRLMNAYQN